jgi:hypothetical protein
MTEGKLKRIELKADNLHKIKRNMAETGSDDYIVWDKTLRGFGLRLRGDTAAFIYQYKIKGHPNRRIKRSGRYNL